METNDKIELHSYYEQDETQLLLQSYHKEPVWRQYLAALTASIISMAVGCVLGWPSSALPLLMSGQATELGGIREISTEEASWVVALLSVGCLVGALPSGQLCLHFGRKQLLMIIGILATFSWIFIIWNGNNIAFLYFGRFICGCVVSCSIVPLTMYTNEICCDMIRGRSGVIIDTMQIIGILFVYSVSAATTLFWTSISCLTIPVIFLCIFYWMPESPLYLIKNGKQSEAIKSIKWLHGEGCNVENEFMKIRLALLEGKKNFLIDDEESSSYLESIRKFFNNLNESAFKSIAIIFLLFMIQRSCGSSMVIAYGEDIFKATRANIPPQTATILTGITQLIFSASSIALVDRLGRKILLRISLSVMTLCSGIYVIYMIFLDKGYAIENEFGWIPVLAMCLFVGTFRLGLGPIPWFLGPELIPTEVQRWALSIIYFIGWVVSFIWNKSYLAAVASFGYAFVFGIFMIICALGFILTFIIPETKNKSRPQIQEALGRSSSRYLDLKPNGSIVIENKP